MYDYNIDDVDTYNTILNSADLKQFGRFMAQWLPLNHALSLGRSSPYLIRQAAFVAAAMPNFNSIPEVKNYGHLMDAITGTDLAQPINIDVFVKGANGGELPEWNRAYYKANTVFSRNEKHIPDVAKLKTIDQKQNELTELSQTAREDGLEWPNIPLLALCMLGVGNMPVYDSIQELDDKATRTNDMSMEDHPAYHFVVNKYPALTDDPEQALFPAVILDRLIRPLYDAQLSGSALHGNVMGQIAHIVDKYGINTLEKADVGTQSSKFIQILEEVRQQCGLVASLLAYHLYCVPVIVASTDSMALFKMEQVVMLLKNDMDNQAKPAAKVIYFRGEPVHPGIAHSKDEQYTIVKDNKTHYLAIPSKEPNTVVKLPKNKEGTHFKNVAYAHEVWMNNSFKPKMDADKHGIAHLNTSPEQRALIHGADTATWRASEPSHFLAGINEEQSGWVRSPKGGLAYMKHDESGNGHEAVFHNMARDFFGLGQYVPTTAAFSHPTTSIYGNNRFTIQNAVDGAEHADVHWPDYSKLRDSSHQKNIISNLTGNGDLDKLGIMDAVMGSHDRHANNYLFSKNGLHLIDNEMLFENSSRSLPHYWELSDKGNVDTGPNPIHPAAIEWANKLDSKHLEASLIKNGVDADLAAEAGHRLRSVQGAIRGHGQPTRKQVFTAALPERK